MELVSEGLALSVLSQMLSGLIKSEIMLGHLPHNTTLNGRKVAHQLQKFINKENPAILRNRLSEKLEAGDQLLTDDQIIKMHKKFVQVNKNMDFICIADFNVFLFSFVQSYHPVDTFIIRNNVKNVYEPHYIPELIGTLHLKLDPTLEGEHTGATKARVLSTFEDWFFFMILTNCFDHINNIMIVLDCSTDCDTTIFFKDLLCDNLNKYSYSAPFYNEKDPLIACGTILCNYSNLETLATQEQQSLKELISCETYEYVSGPGKFSRRARNTSYCGTTKNGSFLSNVGNVEIKVIPITGIDYVRYNAIPKDKLMVEICQLFLSRLIPRTKYSYIPV